jgi:hypothetical protein
MTVSSIVQSLLEKGHITAEEALVLLKAELNRTTYPITPIMPYSPPIPSLPNLPFSPTCPNNPNSPIYPSIPGTPQIWFSSGTGNPGPSGTLNDNFTSK